VLTRDTASQFAGGAEVQQSLLARGLARRGYRVSMICADHGQAARTEVDGVSVIRCRRSGEGLPGVRFFHPWASGLWAAMRAADADVYYQRTASAVTGIVALFARRHGKRFIYAAAAREDLARPQTWRLFQRRAGWRDRTLYSLGIRWSDAIVAQHAGQAADCERWFRREAVTAPSCYEVPREARAAWDGVVLWVSTLRTWKRPERFLDLARQLPHVRFRMIGGPGAEPGAPALFDEIQSRAATIRNLDFVGFVPPASIEPHFNAARVLVNTSDREGFPNTFLQAWARGIPTISFCDTGSVVDGQPFAPVVNTVEEMADATRALIDNDTIWFDAGTRAKHYLEMRHTVDAALNVYEPLFDRLCGTQSRRSGEAQTPAA
jgi:glycosyltransferase involved in cell wall biosynthesis